LGKQAEEPIADAFETERGISRRDFMQGAAATGLVMVGSGYVKPALKLAGVTRLASTASAPPARVHPKKKKNQDDNNNNDDQKNSGDD
jgi:hypothetical protein